jgi:hypothetical protein
MLCQSKGAYRPLRSLRKSLRPLRFYYFTARNTKGSQGAQRKASFYQYIVPNGTEIRISIDD